MAGLGYKDFTAGAVLTAAQVDGYLMEQSVMNFAGTAARGSALASVLSAGQMAHVGGGTVTVYDGSAWQQVYPNTPGLVYVAGTAFSAASSVSVNNCFSSTYDVYRMVLRLDTSIDCWLRMRVGGVDESGSNYRLGRYFVGVTTSSAAGSTNNQTDTYAFIGAGDSNGALSVVDIGFPALAKYTRFASHNSAGLLQVASSALVNTTVYDGFTLLPTSSTVSGNLRVYGYRNS